MVNWETSNAACLNQDLHLFEIIKRDFDGLFKSNREK